MLGNEVTWSSSGIIYIDGSSLPNSNIFDLFLYIFRAKKPKNLVGFSDFCDKIIEMGLGDLIYKKPKAYQAPQVQNEHEDTKTANDAKKVNWWFLD